MLVKQDPHSSADILKLAYGVVIHQNPLGFFLKVCDICVAIEIQEKEC